jgi:hypothetical protein
MSLRGRASYGAKQKLCLAVVAAGMVTVDMVNRLVWMRWIRLWLIGGFTLLVVMLLVLFCIEQHL